ncbi:hypothetical protein MIR68_004651 [Amoeboaphelidium protococcarum]|nr:hypothetical protein MIR68_004651 [Amoeboaphelidium protococcarum]
MLSANRPHESYAAAVHDAPPQPIPGTSKLAGQKDMSSSSSSSSDGSATPQQFQKDGLNQDLDMMIENNTQIIEMNTVEVSYQIGLPQQDENLSLWQDFYGETISYANFLISLTTELYEMVSEWWSGLLVDNVPGMRDVLEQSTKDLSLWEGAWRWSFINLFGPLRVMYSLLAQYARNNPTRGPILIWTLALASTPILIASVAALSVIGWTLAVSSVILGLSVGGWLLFSSTALFWSFIGAAGLMSSYWITMYVMKQSKRLVGNVLGFASEAEDKLSSRVSQVRDQVKGKLQEGYEDVKESSAQLASKVRNQSSELASEFASKVQESFPQATETVQSAASDVKDYAQDVAGKVQRDGLVAGAQKVAGDAGQQAQDLSKQARDAASEKVNELGEKARETFPKTADALQTVSDDAKDMKDSAVETVSDLAGKAADLASEKKDYALDKAEDFVSVGAQKVSDASSNLNSKSAQFKDSAIDLLEKSKSDSLSSGGEDLDENDYHDVKPLQEESLGEEAQHKVEELHSHHAKVIRLA